MWCVQLCTCARPEEDTECPFLTLFLGLPLNPELGWWSPFYLCLILLPPIIGVSECIAMPGFLCGLLGIQTHIFKLAW